MQMNTQRMNCSGVIAFFGLVVVAVLHGARGLPFPAGAVAPDEAREARPAATSRFIASSMVGWGGSERMRVGVFLEKIGGNGGGCHRPADPGRGVGARVSVLCPYERKSDSKMGREWVAMRTLSEHVSVWVGALGRLLCPRRSKKTAADEMGRAIGVALEEGPGRVG